MSDSEPTAPPDRYVEAWQLRPGDWVQRFDVVQKIMSIKNAEDRSTLVFTSRVRWLPLRRRELVGIWYRDPRPTPVGDPNALF